METSEGHRIEHPEPRAEHAAEKPIEPRVARSKRRAVYNMLAAVQVTLIAAISLVSVGLPAVQQEFGLDEAQLTLVTSGYGLAFSGLLVLGGRLGDVYGRGRTFAVGLVLFAFASLCGATAGSASVLIAARFAQGAGAALAAPAALALAERLFTDPAERSRALASWGGLSATGAVSGMLLSGGIVAWLGWRWIFVPPILVSLLALVALALLFPERPHLVFPGRRLRILPSSAFPRSASPNLASDASQVRSSDLSRARTHSKDAHQMDVAPRDDGNEPSPVPGPAPLDMPGATLITAGLAVTTYGLLALARNGGSLTEGAIPPRAIPLEVIPPGAILVAGLSLLVAFWRVERRAPHPLIPLEFFGEQRRLLALAAILLASAASAATNFFLSLYLQQIRGLSPLATSSYFFPMLLIAALSGAAGRWIGYAGPVAVTGAGLGIMSLALRLITLGIDRSVSMLTWAGVCLFPVGLGPTFAGAMVGALASVPDHRRGVAGGVANTAMEAGPTIGLAALVSLGRAKAAAMAHDGASPAGATASGYALALYSAALHFAVAAAASLVAARSSHRERAAGSS